MKFFKKELTTPYAVIITGLIISASIFITGFMFSSRPNRMQPPIPPNAQQLRNPALNRDQPTPNQRTAPLNLRSTTTTESTDN